MEFFSVYLGSSVFERMCALFFGDKRPHNALLLCFTWGNDPSYQFEFVFVQVGLIC